MSKSNAYARGVFLQLGTCLLLAAGLTQAADDFTFSGFGSIGAVHENGRDIGFVRNATQPQLESNNTSYLNDTILGLQANYVVTPQWELVGQLVARDQERQTLNTALEWAYAHWRPSEQLDLRFGRVGVDMFLLSDYRNVGFAQTWVRPPNEFYGWIPMFSLNGADATYHFNSENVRWHLKGQYGKTTSVLPTSSTAEYEFKGTGGTISLRADRGPWQFMTAASSLEVTSEAIPSVLNSNLADIANNAFVPQNIRNEAAQLNQGLWTKSSSVRYQMVGMSYQDGTWQWQSELANVSAESPLLPNGKTGYMMVGRRFGQLTPYVVASAFHPDDKAKQPVNNWSALGSRGTTLQAAAVGAYNSYYIDQRSLALGARWDLNNNTALKLQVDRKWIGARGFGLWQIDNTTSGFSDARVNVFSAVVDFSF